MALVLAGVGKTISNSLKKQSIDTTQVDVIEPIDEGSNTTTIVVISILVILMGLTGVYFLTKKK